MRAWTPRSGSKRRTLTGRKGNRYGGKGVRGTGTHLEWIKTSSKEKEGERRGRAFLSFLEHDLRKNEQGRRSFAYEGGMGICSAASGESHHKAL